MNLDEIISIAWCDMDLDEIVGNLRERDYDTAKN